MGGRKRALRILAVGLWGTLALAEPLLPDGPLSRTARSSDELEEGRQLALKYCAGCHRFAEPSVLDERTWRTGTEPMMRRLMNFDRLDTKDPGASDVAREWRLIWDWYFALAPTNTPPARKIPQTLAHFTPVFLDYRPTNKLVTLVQIDPGRRRLYVGNQETKTLDTLDASGRGLSSVSVESPPVGLVERSDGWYAPLIWDLSPHDARKGKVVRLGLQDGRFGEPEDVLTRLPRPTSLAGADLNGDGRQDWVVCGYGNREGAVSWWEKTDSGYAEHVLFDRPGGVHVEVTDLNRDGRPDLVVQLAQAQEGLYWFENRGGGDFEVRTIAEYHPAWGSSGFQLVDFDRDGDEDLLATNGDSGEYPSCFKDYHGVRLYLNEGPSNFREAFFFPLNGAFGVRAADFDLDGDLDLAAISFFPDYARAAEESFVLLWNEGGLTFRPETLDAGASGRWLVMDAGDLDGDGDADIVLGAANRVPFRVPAKLSAAWEQFGPTVLLLRNERK